MGVGVREPVRLLEVVQGLGGQVVEGGIRPATVANSLSPF